MFLDFLDDNSSAEELDSFFATEEDLNILNDADEINVTKNNESSDNDIESRFSFDAEDLAEWINEDDDLSEKCASLSDDDSFLECSLRKDGLDNESHFTFDAADLVEWMEQENHDNNTSSSSSLPSTNQIQITTMDNDEKINHANNLKTINHDKSMCTNLVKSEMNNNGALDLFHRLNSLKLRTEISRQKVLQCKVTASNLSTNGNERCRSFNLDSLKKRRFLFDLHESQKRLKSFSLQPSTDVKHTDFLGKRISLSEGTEDGRQNRLRQLRNETPNNNHMALAA